MLSGDETTDDPVIADNRNFYKVELWTRSDVIERMLFAGTSLDKAVDNPRQSRVLMGRHFASRACGMVPRVEDATPDVEELDGPPGIRILPKFMP
jgi:hypothetical protein